ncbi:MAG: hypothetical protein Q4F60_00030 [Candidatus Saccharibacteria bacterium]|nr:hypothetical protein [Candidatus Saccharibacteria bacterium]
MEKSNIVGNEGEHLSEPKIKEGLGRAAKLATDFSYIATGKGIKLKDNPSALSDTKKVSRPFSFIATGKGRSLKDNPEALSDDTESKTKSRAEIKSEAKQKEKVEMSPEAAETKTKPETSAAEEKPAKAKEDEPAKTEQNKNNWEIRSTENNVLSYKDGKMVYTDTSGRTWVNGEEIKKSKPEANKTEENRMKLPVEKMGEIDEEVERRMQRINRDVYGEHNGLTWNMRPEEIKNNTREENSAKPPEKSKQEEKEEIINLEQEAEKSEFEPQSAEELFDHVLDVLGPEKVEKTYLARADRLADIGKDVTSRNMKDLKREFETRFSNYQANHRPKYIALSRATLQSAKTNYNNLVRDNLISQDVAKAWLQQDFLQNKFSMYGCYRDIQVTEILEDNSLISPEAWNAKKQKYRSSAMSLVRKHPNAFWQSGNVSVNPDKFWADNDFIHINANKNTGDIDLRCYITPDFTKDPATVLDAWQDALEDTGLQDSIYFKITGGLGEPTHQRLDSIVVYKDPNTPDDVFRNLLETFRRRCQQSNPEALADDPRNLPATTQEIAPGITVAPEPKFINEVLRTSAETKDGNHFSRHSWTTFVERMLIVSMSLAANRLQSSQQPATRDSMCSEAKKCFRELMLLSKINPDTMLPVEYNNARPSWMNLDQA